jgi:hypothetical protein
MTRWQAELEHRQAVLGRIVDIGAELFAIASAVVYADTIACQHPDRREAAYELADLFPSKRAVASTRCSPPYGTTTTAPATRPHSGCSTAVTPGLSTGSCDCRGGELGSPAVPHRGPRDVYANANVRPCRPARMKVAQRVETRRAASRHSFSAWARLRTANHENFDLARTLIPHSRFHACFDTARCRSTGALSSRRAPIRPPRERNA